MKKPEHKDILRKARENGEKHGKAAELDFGAGAEWMQEKYEAWVKATELTEDEIFSLFEKAKKELGIHDFTRWVDCNKSFMNYVAKAITKAQKEKRGGN